MEDIPYALNLLGGPHPINIPSQGSPRSATDSVKFIPQDLDSKLVLAVRLVGELNPSKLKNPGIRSIHVYRNRSALFATDTTASSRSYTPVTPTTMTLRHTPPL